MRRTACSRRCRPTAYWAPPTSRLTGTSITAASERHAAAWDPEGFPIAFNGRPLERDWDLFEPLMTNAVARAPPLKDAEVVRLVNGPEAFTPDGEFILCPSEVRGFWVAAG